VGAIAANIPEAAKVERNLRTAETAVNIAAILRNRVAEPFRTAAVQLGRAALESTAVIAISPHASWDGMFVALRGLIVIRQVAVLDGLRPGTMETIVLMRKVAMAAIGTASNCRRNALPITH
jgi:uncharacterized membrane protein YcjF (UPF0283 family)